MLKVKLFALVLLLCASVSGADNFCTVRYNIDTATFYCGSGTIVVGSAHALLSATHSDTVVQTVSRGSLIYGNSTPKWDELTIGASGKVIHSDGTDASWQSLVDADIPNTITIDTATTATLGDSATAFFSTGTLEPSLLSSTAMADDKVWVGDSSSAVTPKAVPDCDTSTTSKLLYDTTTNAFSCGTDQSSVSGDSQVDFLTRRLGQCVKKTRGATTFTCYGLSDVVLEGVGGSSASANSNALGLAMISYTTGTTSGNFKGVIGDVSATDTVIGAAGGPGWNPVFKTKIATDATITSTRICVGLTSASLNALSTSATTSAISFARTCYDTGGASDTTHWQNCNGNATNTSCHDSGVVVNASSLYAIKIDCTAATSCTFTINGTADTYSTNMNAGASGTYELQITTLTNAARTFSIGSWGIEQN